MVIIASLRTLDDAFVATGSIGPGIFVLDVGVERSGERWREVERSGKKWRER